MDTHVIFVRNVMCIFLIILPGSSCQNCPGNCATCLNANSCITCKSGFYSPSSNCNPPCPTNCFNGICNETTGHCFECPKNSYGYICNLNCGLCKDEHCGLRKCTDGCKGGYWQYQDGEHFECRACMDNCSSCDAGSFCDVCNDGSYCSEVSGTRNYCLVCRPGCVTCSSENSCPACKPGYYGYACDFMCSAKISDCVLCNWDGGTTLTCNQCDNGFTLQNNTCVIASQQCPNNCESCTRDHVCEICNTGWFGALCDKQCHDMSHCVACQETNGSIVCITCNEGYVVLAGKCRVLTPNSTTLPEASSTYTSRPNTPISTTTKTSKTSYNSAVPDDNTSYPQSQNTGFQTSTFVIGLVTGLGICACIILVVGLVWVLRRRRRLLKPATSRQNEPFYENSVTANEPTPISVTSHGPKPEYVQELLVVTENVSQSMEDEKQASVYEESVPTSTDIEQHEYTSLNVRQGEHIYKDLTPL